MEYSEGDVQRAILLSSPNGGLTWTAGGNVYAEGDVDRVILLGSADGTTWTPVTDPSTGGGGGASVTALDFNDEDIDLSAHTSGNVVITIQSLSSQHGIQLPSITTLTGSLFVTVLDPLGITDPSVDLDVVLVTFDVETIDNGPTSLVVDTSRSTTLYAKPTSPSWALYTSRRLDSANVTDVDPSRTVIDGSSVNSNITQVDAVLQDLRDRVSVLEGP